MPRYVILEHDHPHLHWDLMLEAGDVLRTWRLSEPPTPERGVAAEPIGDHRCLYLDYEGPVSGNRGQVTRWDAGTFTWQVDEPRQVVVALHGQRLRTRLLLEASSGGPWQLRLLPP
jgi:hypothetical protein